MADNVTLPGTGQIVATKEIGGVEYQVMLLADGTYTIISPATSGKQDELLTELEKKADLTETQPVSAATLPLPSGAATSAKQLADGHEVKLPASQISTLTPPAAITGFATSAKQDTLLTELQLKADLTETQPVSAVSLPLPAGAATSAKQLADGHNVAVSNQITGFATSAKQLADGHNVAVSNFPAVQSIDQDAVADLNNSSTVNLSAANGYSFEGDGTDTLGVNSIQVSLFADQNCTVKIEQSPDGDDSAAHWDLEDTYNYYASTKNFGITVQAISSYVRVIVTTASLTTTEFRLQTVLCPIADPLPRSLDAEGNFKVGIKSTEDQYGFDVENTPIGEMRTVVPTRLVGANFEGGTIDTNFWISGVANSGTVVQANACVTLSTATTSANGIARFYSYRRARYVSGSSMCYRSVIVLSAAAADNKRRWGLAYASTMPTTGTTDLMTDGAWFQFDGTTFGVALRRAGVVNETLITSGSFNGRLGLTYTPGITVKTYEIYWTNSKVYFIIGGKVLHTFSADTTTWSSTMNFYIYNDNVNSNNLQTNHTLELRVASIRRLGSLLTQPTSYYHASGQTGGINLKLSAGNLHTLVINNAANNSVITLSDSVSAATPALFVHTAGATTTAAYSLDFKGLPFFFGLRLTVASANASCTIIYE